jgi:hypothetical protein
VARRVNDLATRRRSYKDVLGLEPLGVFEHTVFYCIASGYKGDV